MEGSEADPGCKRPNRSQSQLSHSWSMARSALRQQVGPRLIERNWNRDHDLGPQAYPTTQGDQQKKR